MRTAGGPSTQSDFDFVQRFQHMLVMPRVAAHIATTCACCGIPRQLAATNPWQFTPDGSVRRLYLGLKTQCVFSSCSAPDPLFIGRPLPPVDLEGGCRATRGPEDVCTRRGSYCRISDRSHTVPSSSSRTWPARVRGHANDRNTCAAERLLGCSGLLPHHHRHLC
jgi:hypothetical protein